MTISHTDNLLQKSVGATTLVVVPGVWVRLLSNNTATNYYSTAVSDVNGAFTHSAPPDDYSLYYGAAATVPGTPTLVNAHYAVPVTAGDDLAAKSYTASSSPYAPSAYVAGGQLYGQLLSTTRPFNVLAQGAKGDLRRVMDGAITTGTAILTSATAAFTSADVGKLAYVHNAGNGGGTIPLLTTVLSYQSATQVTLAANALATVSAQEVMISTDDGAAINNTILLASSAVTLGSKVVMPAAEYGTSVTINGKTGVSVEGEGSGITGVLYDLMQTGGYGLNFPSTVAGTPKTSRICWLGAANGTVFLESGIRNAGLYDIDLDGTYTAGVGLDVASAFSCTHRNVTVERASNSPGTGIRLRTLTDAVNQNCVYNRFEDCSTWWHNYGAQYSGGATGISRCAVNSFTRTAHTTIGATGACIDIIQYADTNWHFGTSLKMLTGSATAYGIIVNDSATPTLPVGCDGNYFHGLAFDAASFSAPNIGVLLNSSLQSFFEIGQCIIKVGNDRSIPTPSNTTYVWGYHNSDTNLMTSFPGPIEANGMSTQGSPAFAARYAGTRDWILQRETASAYVLRALTPNKKILTFDQATGNVLLGDAGTTFDTNALTAFKVTTSGQQYGFQVIDTGANGGSIYLKGDGGTTPSKLMKVNGGVFYLVNDAYTENLLAMTDAGVATLRHDLVLSNVPRILTTGTIPTVGSGGSGTSALSILSGSTNTSGRFQVTLTAVAPGVVAGVVAFGGGAQPTAPLNVVCSLSAPTAGVASPPIVGADTFTTSGFTIRVYGPTTVTTGTYVINFWVSF